MTEVDTNIIFKILFLQPDPDLPREQWKVIEKRDIPYLDYLQMSVRELANTRVDDGS